MRGELSTADFERLCAAIAVNEDTYMEEVASARAKYVPTAAMPSLPPLDDTHISFHPCPCLMDPCAPDPVAAAASRTLPTLPA